jgi:DNA polymerase-3 subunit delta'
VTFREVFGHARNLERLRRCLASGRVAHAYLFVGPEGVGKSTVAQAFACALTCPAEPGEGCGACPSCQRILSGNHPDVHVVEPEGQVVKIEQIRVLQEALAFRPAFAPRSVAVLSRAERMTLQAANALLKTLEEPPGKTVIVLVSPTASLLPSTVVSRCEQIPFAPIPTEELADFLVARRGMTPEAASLAAAMAAGRVGPALEADLGELKALRSKAWEFLKAATEGPASVLEWSQAWFDEKRRGRSSLKVSGLELSQALLGLTRDLVVSASGQRKRLIHPDLDDRYGSLSVARNTAAAAAAFNAVQEAQGHLARNLNPQLVCEAMGLAIAEASRG